MEQITPKFQIGDEVETNDLYKTLEDTYETLLGADKTRKPYRCGRVTDIQVKTIELPLWRDNNVSMVLFDQRVSVDIPQNPKWITRTLVMVALDDSTDPLNMIEQDLLQLRSV